MGIDYRVTVATTVLVRVTGTAPPACLHVLLRVAGDGAAEASPAALDAEERGAAAHVGAALEGGVVADGAGTKHGRTIGSVASVHIVRVAATADGDRVGGHDGVDGRRGRVGRCGEYLRSAGEGLREGRRAVVPIQHAAADDAVSRNERCVAACQLRVDVDGVVVAVAAARVQGACQVTAGNGSARGESVWGSLGFVLPGIHLPRCAAR